MAYAMNIAVLMDILLSYYDPAALHLSPDVSFSVFSQTRLVYPQFFLTLSLCYHYYEASMINALDYVASQISLIRYDR
jgi:hypothetical protein